MTLSYHFAGIMSMIKSGKEIEDIRPQKRLSADYYVKN